MSNSSIAGPQQTVGSRITDTWVRDEDDWSGITNLRERRRIQNRRNQRILRARRRKELESPNSAISEDHYHGNAILEAQQLVPAYAVTQPPLISTQQNHTDHEIEALTAAIRRINILDFKSEHTRVILQHFEAFACHYYLARSPQITLLPSLSQFNFIRALIANVEVLGLSAEEMDDDALSPFNNPLDAQNPGNSTALVARLPGGLRPTALQRTTLHHPWIDLLPIPAMRDNIFRRGLDNFDEDELCHNMRGYIPGQDPGVLVWRDPWDPVGWEVTEAFLAVGEDDYTSRLKRPAHEAQLINLQSAKALLPYVPPSLQNPSEFFKTSIPSHSIPSPKPPPHYTPPRKCPSPPPPPSSSPISRSSRFSIFVISQQSRIITYLYQQLRQPPLHLHLGPDLPLQHFPHLFGNRTRTRPGTRRYPGVSSSWSGWDDEDGEYLGNDDDEEGNGNADLHSPRSQQNRHRRRSFRHHPLPPRLHRHPLECLINRMLFRFPNGERNSFRSDPTNRGPTMNARGRARREEGEGTARDGNSNMNEDETCV